MADPGQKYDGDLRERRVYQLGLGGSRATITIEKRDSRSRQQMLDVLALQRPDQLDDKRGCPATSESERARRPLKEEPALLQESNDLSSPGDVPIASP
jgi:hypothetical protein